MPAVPAASPKLGLVLAALAATFAVVVASSARGDKRSGPGNVSERLGELFGT